MKYYFPVSLAKRKTELDKIIFDVAAISLRFSRRKYGMESAGNIRL